jgi:hypothetical protein
MPRRLIREVKVIEVREGIEDDEGPEEGLTLVIAGGKTIPIRNNWATKKDYQELKESTGRTFFALEERWIMYGPGFIALYRTKPKVQSPDGFDMSDARRSKKNMIYRHLGTPTPYGVVQTAPNPQFA